VKPLKAERETPKQEFESVSVPVAFDALKTMQVHGAGRIARFAAQALRDYASNTEAKTPKEYWDLVQTAGERLRSARPTAVSLPNAVNYVLYGGRTAFESGSPVADIRQATIDSANDFLVGSIAAVKVIGEIGAKRIKNGDTIITHCNSEAAISIMKTAHDLGRGIKVICDETRPRYQGRKTAATLADYGIDTTIIIDSACRLFIDKADRVIVGCDAISANGALVNKVGTSQVALLAHESRVNFMVAAETYKIDFKTLTGELIEIEERDALEVAPKEWMTQHPNVKFHNPAFDVTPPQFVDFYVTEKGLIPPGGILAMMKELYRYSDGSMSIGKAFFYQ